MIGIRVAWLYISSFLYCNKMKIKTISIISKLRLVRFFLIFFFLVSLDNICWRKCSVYHEFNWKKKMFNLPSNNNVFYWNSMLFYYYIRWLAALPVITKHLILVWCEKSAIHLDCMKFSIKTAQKTRHSMGSHKNVWTECCHSVNTKTVSNFFFLHVE